jgi:hypothetical protein
MRRVTAMVSAAAVVLWMATAFAQGPNFSGTWTREAPAGGAAGGGGGAAGGGGGARGGGGGGGGAFNCGAECTIVMDAKTVTIKRPANAQTGTTPPDIVLNVTGVTKLEQPGRGGAAPTQYEVTAKVEGAKWVVTRTMDMQGTSITNTQTISLEGGKLTVVTTSTREGATPQTITYTKK